MSYNFMETGSVSKKQFSLSAADYSLIHVLKRVACMCAWTILTCMGASAQSALQISQITDNRDDYSGSQIPRYEKFEITFQVENTVAGNLQLPYDPDPPPGLASGEGISVDALLTPDNWQTVYTQPAFYYEEFLDEIRSGREWFYPTGLHAWKVRFAPHLAGNWQYKLVAQDTSGITESGSIAFTVTESSNSGFLQVSETDPRYFEFADGAYFPGLGFNMNYDHMRWVSPVLDNQNNMQTMAANGIQLIRIWLSQWSIYGSEWNPWYSQDPVEHSTYLPATGITFSEAYPGSDVSMAVKYNQFRCMYIGDWKARPAVKRNTQYRIRIRYMTKYISGPVDPAQPYGLVAKTGGWLWSDNEAERCYSPGTGTLVTSHQNQNTEDWQILEGSLNSGNSDFLPNFFLVMENAEHGTAYIDHVAIEEDLGNGNYGPNIVSKPWMAHHLYFEQRNSYAFDKLLDLAKAHGIYLRPVVLEKNERIFNQINFAGEWQTGEPNNYFFYGNWRETTKVRWLQKAWWRYLQARWGYSTNIHSWELLNEGDPFSGQHYTLADEFGKYMHQFTANRRMVSTSTWLSFPNSDFWANSNYPDVDFADVHLYIPRDAEYTVRTNNGTFVVGTADDYPDTAFATRSISELIGALQPAGAGKPVIRGETGFVVSGSEPFDSQLLSDQDGIWLHNFIWGGINPGGLIESYWYELGQIYGRTDGVDLRYRYKSYFDFIKSIPLNNGAYEDAQAASSDPQLRAWGQKDTNNGRAHLWIQNAAHDWRNAVAGVTPEPITASVSLGGFLPNTGYAVEWWDTYSAAHAGQSTLFTDGGGTLNLSVVDLTTDTAVRIGDYPDNSARPAAPTNLRIVP